MSEYQYYEFAAIDKPLTAAQMAALRERSTRATITPASFINEYQWGNLKGDPADWMRRYFDAHVYVANWCSCWLYLRLPKDALDAGTLGDYTTQDALTSSHTSEHWILRWALSESEDYDRFGGADDGRGWMARLLPLRDELLRGDLRALYLGWLAGVNAGEVDDDAVEPPPPPGLSRLTTAQQSLAKFLDIDEDLVAAAGASGPQATAVNDADAVEAVEQDLWIAQVPAVEQAAMLKLLLSGQGQQAERQLKSAFLSWQRKQRPVAPLATQRRTVAALRELADSSAQIRQERHAAQRKRAEAERKARREAQLRIMAAHFDRHWQAADTQAQRAGASGYDEAKRTLGDLAEAYELCATRGAFDQELATFMLRHGKRTALVRRLVEAGLWKKMK